MQIIESSGNLDADIDRYLMQGFRMEMISPSDAPREVVLSKGPESVKLLSKNRIRASNTDWVTGRAGMMYRDLIPDRLGGNLIASHIRLLQGGTVPDYVHYHKIIFQLIYCLRGRICVVYEGQGEPFWLEPGDCVLQPPEIRHRVLECTAGSEVLEVTSPAEHETWVEHVLTLPNEHISADRDLSGQRFVRHIDKLADWSDSNGYASCDLGIGAATNNLADVRSIALDHGTIHLDPEDQTRLIFVVKGELTADMPHDLRSQIAENAAFVLPANSRTAISAARPARFIEIKLPAYPSFQS